MMRLIAFLPADTVNPYECSRSSGLAMIVGLAVWLWWGAECASDSKLKLKRILLSATVPMFFTVFNIGTLIDSNCSRFHPIVIWVLLAGPLIGSASFCVARLYRYFKTK